ncbi:MAG: antitoxin MazE family protein [Defluviicoccus sp.]|nr:antitoxin MazE family protein [Defluviicoccus sp.]MDG4591428.1 antitoxin MazE family protein [Defluviicoccus sp.]MDG4604228.1 antitoxin MazE family protein [Defluviicoccus sp.]MDG4608829.1 antitoxin MazE family protein [Defluviicoccus sp.]
MQRSPKSPAEKMRTYRSRLRAAGLRPVQIWVPDVRAADLVEEARRQSRRASMHAGEREALDVIERLADLDDDPS